MLRVAWLQSSKDETKQICGEYKKVNVLSATQIESLRSRDNSGNGVICLARK